MKRYAKRIAVGVCIPAVLCLVYWWGGNAPTLRGWKVETGERLATNVPSAAPEESQRSGSAEDSLKPPKDEQTPDTAETGEEPSRAQAKTASAMPTNTENGQAVLTEKSRLPISERPPVTEEEKPQTDHKADIPKQCTLTIRCDTILRHLDWLAPEKHGLVPSNGILLAERSVTFYEGESVFHLLLRETKKNKIHMEFVNTPIYKSAYVEGIGNLYELDCGELSGWMYCVNGEFPNYGCSRYILHEGDRVEWVYTCDMGADVGNGGGGGQKDE